MKTRRLGYWILTVVFCLCVFSVPACAADAADRDIGQHYNSLNENTGNRVCVIDEEGQLDAPDTLAVSLRPLTDYCTVIFWTCRVSEDDQDVQVGEWQNSGFADDSVVLVFNEQEGYYTFYTHGAVKTAVPNDKLNEICDSMHEQLRQGDLDGFAKNGFSQIYRELSGEELPEPETSFAQGLCYENPDTGYQVMILDDIDLLTDDEEKRLVEDMKPITEFGHIIFWSTNIAASNAEEQAKEKRASFYGRESAGILSINMNSRYITFHSDGDMNKLVNASYARTVTDNASHYASEKRYYDCAHEVFFEVNEVLHGNRIAEPMKYISYTVIALMAAFVLVVWFVFGKRRNPLNRRNRNLAKYYGKGQLMANKPTIRKTYSDMRVWLKALLHIGAFILECVFEGIGSGGSGGHSGGSGGHSGGSSHSSSGGSGGSSRF